MSDQTRPTEFVAHDVYSAAVVKYIQHLARECSYIEERFRFHWHLYRNERRATEREVMADYFAHLGYAAECAPRLPEIDMSSAHDILAEMFRWDLARNEELVTEEEARRCVDLVREDTDPWAILAFTNLDLPKEREYRLGSYPFVRVVAALNIEGGVLFIGTEDIAMLWFLDDDGPSRAICDRRYRGRSRRK